MASVRKVVKNCAWEFAKRQRRCARDKSHIIAAGEKCLVVKENMAKKNYCLQCAKLIISCAKKDIEELCVQLWEINKE